MRAFASPRVNDGTKEWSRAATEPSDCTALSPSASRIDRAGRRGDYVLIRYDLNRNGGTMYEEARRHGVVPVLRLHPALPYLRGGDGNRAVCKCRTQELKETANAEPDEALHRRYAEGELHVHLEGTVADSTKRARTKRL